VGYLADCRCRWFKNFIIGVFVKHYQVDMQAAQETNPRHYASFNDFFTRALKPEARSFVQGKNQIACPVDGTISQIGKIQETQLIQAKGFDFDVASLLGCDATQAELFKNGNFTTLYLAPKDYHRVHMPFDGDLEKMSYIPGRLFSVNNISAQMIPNLFAQNERVVCWFNTKIGPMAVVLVGAMIVGSIETSWSGVVSKTAKMQHWFYADYPIHLRRGEELGRFKLGSTVIVLFGPAANLVFESGLQADTSVQLGQLLGSVDTSLSHSTRAQRAHL
jgi:phosphatidylserine decarboxylase